jgi:hypothetical protein
VPAGRCVFCCEFLFHFLLFNEKRSSLAFSSKKQSL